MQKLFIGKCDDFSAFSFTHRLAGNVKSRFTHNLLNNIKTRFTHCCMKNNVLTKVKILVHPARRYAVFIKFKIKYAVFH